MHSVLLSLTHSFPMRPFSTPFKTSWCFQWVEERYIANKWVKLSSTVLLFANFYGHDLQRSYHMATIFFWRNAANQEFLITVYLKVYTYKGFKFRFVWIPFMQCSWSSWRHCKKKFEVIFFSCSFSCKMRIQCRWLIYCWKSIEFIT